MDSSRPERDQEGLPRPNVSSIRSLREKIFHDMLLFKVIIYTVLILVINNVFLYKSFLYEWLNMNNYHNTVDFMLLVPRYIFYPLIVTSNGTELDLYITCLLLYNFGKRLEILHKVNMKKILLVSYFVNLVVNGLFLNYIVSRLIGGEDNTIFSLLPYPTGSSFLIVSLASKYRFVHKYNRVNVLHGKSL
ncbi:hypothetical protein QEN19_004014 [Hanseniaspora menglaensis]